MQNVGDSWTVSTSFLWLPDEGDVLPAAEVTLVAAQTTSLLNAPGSVPLVVAPPRVEQASEDWLRSGYLTGMGDFGKPGRQDLRAVGTVFELDTLQVSRVRSAPEAIADYLAQLVLGVDRTAEPEDVSALAIQLLDQALVPEFGSPPRDWLSLNSALSGAVSSGAVYLQDGHPVFVLLTGLSTTLFLRIALPAADGAGEAAKVVLREGVEDWLRRLLRVPPRDASDGDEEDNDSGLL